MAKDIMNTRKTLLDIIVEDKKVISSKQDGTDHKYSFEEWNAIFNEGEIEWEKNQELKNKFKKLGETND